MHSQLRVLLARADEKDGYISRLLREVGERNQRESRLADRVAALQVHPSTVSRPHPLSSVLLSLSYSIVGVKPFARLVVLSLTVISS